MLNIRKSIMRPAAVMLSAVMLVGSSFVSENNIDSATETEGTTYIKHYYNSNKPDEEYTLEPIEYSTEFTLSRSIIVGDPRPTIDPPQSMVSISAKISDTKASNGTAFIIDNNTVMTAAHCLYGKNGFFDIESLKITANNVSLSPISCHILKEFKTISDNSTNPGALDGKQIHADYAIITVEEDLWDYEMLGLGLTTSKIINNTPVHVMGYNHSFYSNPQLKLSDGKVKSVSNLNYINTDCFVINGTSGGPLYTKCIINGNAYISVIGVCSGYGSNCYDSFFAEITNEVLQFAYRNSHL